MSGIDEILSLLLGVCVAVWFGLGLYVLVARAVHDVRAAAVERARRIVAGDVDLDRLIRLPPRVIERVAADNATAPPIAAVFAARAFELDPAGILLRAKASNRPRRWPQITALRVLALTQQQAALPLLADALQSEDAEVVGAAVTALGELPGSDSTELLVTALRRGTFSRSRIATQLDNAGEPVWDLLLPALRDVDAHVRFWAATLLGRYAGRPDVGLELAAATQDEDPSVRAAAVESLGRVGAPAAIGATLSLLSDPVFFVRAHAARALRPFESDEIAAAVAPLLADDSWWVRAAAKETLEAHPRTALPVLGAYLVHPDRFARNGAAEIMQNTGALDRLVALIADDSKDADRTLVRRILAAGGDRLSDTAAARAGIGARELEIRAAA